MKVDPITSLEDIKTMKMTLKSKPLDHALFVIGINLGLRASDLLNLKVYRVKDLNSGDNLKVMEKKTGKQRVIIVNKTTVSTIQGLLASKVYDDMDYLFKGQRGPITVKGLHAKVQSWCKKIHLKGNYGTHTLRKTWAYHQRVTFKVDWPTISDALGHASQKQTMVYLCIQPEEIVNMYQNEL